MLTEEGYKIGESTVRKYIQQMRINKPDIFVSLEFEPGEAMEVDWGDACAIIAEAKTKVSMFCAVLPYSYGIHSTVFPNKVGECFYTGHIKAFEFFGGVPLKCIYDNLKTAVLKGFGKDAVKQEKFKIMEAHYAFEAVFCNIAAGWEKGAVENLVAIVRSIAFTPIPRVKDFEELQEHVTQKCVEYCENHKIKTRKYSIKEMLEEEKKHLLPLPLKPLDPCEEIKTKVYNDLTVRVNNVKYSVPERYAELYVTLKIAPFHIDVYYEGKHVFKHKKAFNQNDHQYIPEHYLDILMRKPRAINNALPLKKGIMPKELSNFINLCKSRDKNYQLVQILLLGRKIENEKLLWAVNQANSTGVPSYNLICFYLNLSLPNESNINVNSDIPIDKADFSQYDNLIGGIENYE